MKEFIRKGHTVIVLGTGGVGKTTVAAALGMAGAQSSLDTIAITVDPAQRLRDALGLAALESHPTRIDPRRLRRIGVAPGVRFSAMMLDVERQWNTLVERFVPDPAARERIRTNRFFRSLAGQFAGSDSYAALEQLHDLHETGGFGLEIVDTPPASHALEFLQAPSRLVQLLDSEVTRWMGWGGTPGRFLALRIAGRAARLLARELETFAGTDMIASISDFFATAAGASQALLERFQKAEALLHAPTVHFVIVTTAEADRLRQAGQFVREMLSHGLKPSAVVVNRFLDEEAWAGNYRNGKRLRDLLRVETADTSGTLAPYLENYLRHNERDIERVEQFSSAIPPGIRIAASPMLFSEVADLGTLQRLASYLLSGAMPAGRRSRHQTHHASVNSMRTPE